MIPNLPDQTQPTRDRFHALRGRIAEAFAKLPEEEGLAEIDDVVKRERESQSFPSS